MFEYGNLDTKLIQIMRDNTHSNFKKRTNTLHHNKNIIIVLSKQQQHIVLRPNSAYSETWNVQLIYSAAVKIRCWRLALENNYTAEYIVHNKICLTEYRI